MVACETLNIHLQTPFQDEQQQTCNLAFVAGLRFTFLSCHRVKHARRVYVVLKATGLYAGRIDNQVFFVPLLTGGVGGGRAWRFLGVLCRGHDS